MSLQLNLGERDDAPFAKVHAATGGMETSVVLECPREPCGHRWPIEAEELVRATGMHAMCGVCHRTYTFPLLHGGRPVSDQAELGGGATP